MASIRGCAGGNPSASGQTRQSLAPIFTADTVHGQINTVPRRELAHFFLELRSLNNTMRSAQHLRFFQMVFLHCGHEEARAERSGDLERGDRDPPADAADEHMLA